MNRMVDFLLVIPAYREHLRLPPYLQELVKALSQERFSTKILIVDDGSPRGEQEQLNESVLRGCFGNCEVSDPIFLARNEGKGEAILAGWKSGAMARWVAFVDADGAIPAGEVVRIFAEAYELPDNKLACLFATRIKMLGKRIERRFIRHLIGRIFATIVGNFIASDVYDSQCGFKLVPAEYFRQIADKLQGRGFCFDIELLLALRGINAKLIEVPIDWENKQGSKVNLLKDGVKMLLQIYLIKSRSK
jgi:glycosyltransferase involved in cell wall biosynthesis